jgi:cell wall-associated NlpC family hydrolase
MVPSFTRSWFRGGSSRRSACAATLAACLALLSLSVLPTLAAAAAPAQRGDHDSSRDSLDLVGHALLTALATGGAARTVHSIGDSLAMLEARTRIQAHMRDEPAGQNAPSPPTEKKVASGPGSVPPASAGTNGTVVPHASALHGRIFAHVPASSDPARTAILLTGVALAPPQAPEAVKNVINAANTIVGRPYIWGGGHQSFYSNGYDCSGSVSFALFGGGLIPRPLTSGELEHWGAPGPGRWITVYASATHTFAEIAGLRWDTVGDAQGTGPRWHLPPTSTAGFVVRHPPGY